MAHPDRLSYQPAPSETNREARPTLDDNLPLQANFDNFYGWALGLESPVAHAETTVPAKDRRRHAVGFNVFYLDRSPKYTVRLHHYPTAGEIEKDVHDHAFKSRSGVLSGTLIETVYGLEETTDGAEALYCYDDATGVQQVEESNERYRVEEATVQEFHRGDTFDLTPGKIHSVAVKDDTVTLMVKTTSQPFQKALVIKPEQQR
jgi:hypothetical protein